MSRIITQITLQKRNRSRLNIFLDGAYAFSIDQRLGAELVTGDLLPEQKIAALKGRDAPHRAYDAAVRYLSYRARSVFEMRSHLNQKGFASEVVDLTLARLGREKYLDDTQFARLWTEQRLRHNPRGTFALKQELRAKGIDDTVIAQTLDRIDDNRSAWMAVERSLYRWQRLDKTRFKQKVLGFLSRRGFDYETAYAICDQAWERIEATAERHEGADND